MDKDDIYLETLENLPIKEVIDAAYRAGLYSGFNDDKTYKNELESRIAELEAQIAEHDKHVLDTSTFHPEDGKEQDAPPDIIEREGRTFQRVASTAGVICFLRPSEIDKWIWCSNGNAYLDIKAPPEIWRRFPNRPRVVIPWHGGECPVHPEVKVAFKIVEENQVVFDEHSFAKNLSWDPQSMDAFTITEGLADNAEASGRAAQGTFAPPDGCAFSYVDVTTKGSEGTLNLLFGEYPIAWVNNTVLASEIRKVTPRHNKGITEQNTERKQQ